MTNKGRLPYTARRVVKGRVYWSYRRHGQEAALPGDPHNDEAAAQEYWALRAGRSERQSSKRTMRHLIANYRKSTRWTELKGTTRRSYEPVLIYIEKVLGDFETGKVTRQHINQGMQANAATPRKANYMASLLSVLFEHAQDIGWRKDNPARGVRKLKTGPGYQPWPDWLIRNTRQEATGYTLTAFELALGLGQRVADILALRWSDIEGDEIHLVQSKTGAELWIPMPAHLQAHLETVERRGLTIVQDEKGRPVTYNALRLSLARLRKKTGGDGFSMHGLRYNKAKELAEAGRTDAQIQAITGHATVQMAAKYRKAAQQRKLAREAQG
ncbi:MAG: tyrosine-type recombinase/integrase [Pseudomonadota bacterium]